MARLKIKLDGFEDMLRDIQKAGKDVDKAAKDAIKQSAKIYEQELKSAAKSSGVPDHIVNEVKAETKVELLIVHNDLIVWIITLTRDRAQYRSKKFILSSPFRGYYIIISGVCQH